MEERVFWIMSILLGQFIYTSPGTRVGGTSGFGGGANANKTFQPIKQYTAGEEPHN